MNWFHTKSGQLNQETRKQQPHLTSAHSCCTVNNDPALEVDSQIVGGRMLLADMKERPTAARYIVTHSLSQSLTPTPNNILIPAITGAIKTHLSPFLGTIVSYLSPNLQIITSSCSYDQKHDNKHCWWPGRPDTLIQKIENTIRLLITWCSRAYTVRPNQKEFVCM